MPEPSVPNFGHFELHFQDPEDAIRVILKFGRFSRILTSGKLATAEAGAENIKKWIQKYGHDISFMPGKQLSL